MSKSYTPLFPFFAALFLCTNHRCSGEVDAYQAIFTTIYEYAIWGKNAEGNGTSGHGSRVQHTAAYRNLVEQFMESHNITSVIDVGCGDWEFSQYIAWGTVNYIGYDIVEPVIQRNRARYKSANIDFIHANFLDVDLPAADLLICKDVLQHLFNKDIIKFLAQLPKFKYCLITNEVNSNTLSSDNDDIPLNEMRIGGMRKIDLCRPPFNISGTVLLNYRIGREIHQVLLIDNSACNID